MLFGNPEEFSIHCPPSIVNGQCHFNFTARGKVIGDPIIDSQLIGCIHWAKDFLMHSGKRMRPELCGLPASAVMGYLYDIIYKPGTGDTDWQYFSKMRSVHHMDEIGMDSFRDNFSIILFQESPNVERLIWRSNKSGEINEESYVPGKVDSVLNQFIQKMERKISFIDN